LISVQADKARLLLDRLKQRGLKDSSLIGEVTEISPGTISILP
jgi:hydrogenase maturation factor